MSYLNEQTSDMPMSPKRRQMKFSQQNPSAIVNSSHSVTPMVMTAGQAHSKASNYMPLEKPKSYMEKFQAMQQVMSNNAVQGQRS